MFMTMREMAKHADKLMAEKVGQPPRHSDDKYYSEILDALDSKIHHPLDKKAVVNQVLGEMIWEQTGKPYYSIHPQLVTKLCQVDFSKVPSNLITMPDPYGLICIRLNQRNELLSFEDGKYYLRSMLVWKRQAGQMLDARKQKVEIKDDVLICWVDYGETMNAPYQGCPLYTYKCFPIKDNQMIDDAFDYFPDAPDASIGVNSPREFIENCIKLFISVGFLAASETPLLAFDILNKDVHRWLKADEDGREKMIDRAKRRGKNGWVLGTDQMFASHELQYSHIRAGHPHLYWHGKGKTKLKMRFVAPTTVRKDRPVKQEESE